ncbi:MAG: hypothetical protein E6G41_12960 [Actinobacteria bacterium]|nr:MAG: hypothetical protein E6G41_12960 [Actinomycetota bacterium]
MLSEGATADHVRAALTGDYPAKPFVLDPGAHLSHADIDAGRRAAVIVSDIAGAGPATITDSYVRGGPALLGFHTGQTALLQRDKLVATGDQDAVLTFGGTTIVEDSVIDLRGENGAALGAIANMSAAATVEGRHVTVLGDANTTGATAYSSSQGGPAKATLSDSVLLGVGRRAERTGDGTATLAMTRVDTWPAAPDSVAGAAFTHDGAFSADPLLEPDLMPDAGSRLIDAAAPIGPDESATGFYGTARALDGDGSCDARPDIGAVEAPAVACAPPSPPTAPPGAPNIQPAPQAGDATAPVLSHLRLSTKRVARFELSERATVKLTLRRCANRACTCTRRTVRARTLTADAGARHVRLRRVPPGRYLLRATVVDAAGNRGIARATKARVA